MTLFYQELKEYLHLGFHIGFNGIIFKLNLKDVIKRTPLAQMVLETDCPFFPTSPRKKRNDPLDVKVVAKEIAKLKKSDLNAASDEAAFLIIAGTARSMGIEVEG